MYAYKEGAKKEILLQHQKIVGFYDPLSIKQFWAGERQLISSFRQGC